MKNLLLFDVIIIIIAASYGGNANLTCSKDSDCPDNAYCEGGHHCFCHAGYVDVITDSLRCLKEATVYEDDCEVDIQCTALLSIRSHCRKFEKSVFGRCVCYVDSHYRGGICHKDSFIGERCSVSDDCLVTTLGLQAYCDRGKCICPPNHVPSANKRDCVPIAGLNEKCDSSVPCSVPNSKCNEYCECAVGYVANKNNTRCLPAADTLNDYCEDDAQCSEFLKLSVCDTRSKKCTCQEKTHRVDEQCWLTVELQGFCEHDSECIGGDRLKCINNLCTCRKGYTAVRGVCIPMKVEGFCEDDSECIGGDRLKCINNLCTCNKGYASVKGACIPMRQAGFVPQSSSNVSSKKLSSIYWTSMFLVIVVYVKKCIFE